MSNNMETTKNKTISPKGFLPIFGKRDFKDRRIICSKSVSKKDKDAIIRLYDALVPRKEVEKMRLDLIKKYFPTFDDIDIDMIIDEAFPKFEETIGVENFTKVKRFFGIGCKVNKNQNSKEIDSLLAELRTIENAQYYICGYKELVHRMAKLLDEGDEYTDIEKSKIVRMYSVLFLCNIYFIEDLASGNQINHTQLINNNKMGFYPEELLVLYVSRFTELPEKNIFYDSIIFELNQIKDKKILKEIMEFSELEYNCERFVSVNRANPYQNFALIRKLKQQIHNEPVISPVELFGILKFAKEIDFINLYEIYKTLSSYELGELKRLERKFERFEGSRIVEYQHSCFEISPDQYYIAGEREKARILHLVEILAEKNIPIRLECDLETGEELPEKQKTEYCISQFIGAIKFVKDANLVRETTINRDFEIADELIKRDKKSKVLSKYFMGAVTIEEVKAKLRIDETFEYEFFGIKPKVDHKAVLVNFAIQNGYAESEEKISHDLIENVIISGNEELIERYNSGEISDEQFERKLGLEEFTEMFFDLSKVDISSIEEKLLEVKKTTAGRKKIQNKMIVLLYCYIIEGQIGCGPKHRVPKRNKALKTSILKSLI